MSETITPTVGTNFHTFTQASYRYWRLTFAESGIQYISIGRLALGELIDLPLLDPNVALPYRTNTSTSFSRSTFDVEGDVLKGPARGPLQAFPTHLEDHILILTIV